jgi:hypothetical protein
MTREEMVDLTNFIAVVCPAQKLGRETAVAWYEVIGHLDFEVARNAVIAVKQTQAFVDPSDIIREARRTVSHKPYERNATQAATESMKRELDAAPVVPPTPEYLAAKELLDRKMRERAEDI